MPPETSRAPHDSDPILLDVLPTPIALLYNRMLESENSLVKAETGIDIFILWMSVLTYELLNQYLERDIHQIDPSLTKTLNKILQEQLPRPSLGTIVDTFFHLLDVYRQHQHLLFIRELLHLRWRLESGRKIKHARASFDKLKEIRNDLAHNRKPFTKEQWQSKYDEVYSLITDVLSKFSFIRDYPLIYVIKRQAGRVQLLNLQGLQPSMMEQECDPDTDLNAGKFYFFSKRSGDYLELHPLFLPWPSFSFGSDIQVDELSLSQLHMALYESYTSKKINYFAVTAGLPDLYLRDAGLITEFRRLVEGTLQKYRDIKTEVSQLDWSVLKRIAWEITKSETQSAQDKYSPDLYYQRATVKQTFDDFLTSAKMAFVLLGNSGVGKTSFLLSIHDYYRDQADTVMIVFNAAKLVSDQSLAKTLTELFRLKLLIKDKQGIKQLGDILTEIHQLIRNTSRHVILALDAVNENNNSNELLLRIDHFINHYEYPWLKIVITSRPQAWQSMKRRAGLSVDKYYRSPDTQSLGVELKGFDMSTAGHEGWLRVSRFAQAELPEVYRRYQRKYHLQKSFAELSANIKVLLRDPLALRLIAQTYGSEDPNELKEAFPENLRTSKLYANYIASLLESEKLDREDITVFLEGQLLPLLFKSGAYRNYIHSDTLLEVMDPSGKVTLAEKIDVSDILSSGKRVNQSFQNLVDAGILRKQGTYSDYVIDFNYERFYDYFGGVYLARQINQQADKVSWLREIARAIARQPFLWGPVRRVLLLQIESAVGEQQYRLVEELLKEENQTVQDMLRSALILYARDYPVEGEHLLTRIYQAGMRNRKTAHRTLAVLIAGEAGIAGILEWAGRDRDRGVRFAAIQSGYRYWQQDPAAGFHLLETWAAGIRGRVPIPNPTLAESAMGLSVLIITDNQNTSDPKLRLPDYQNHAIANRLQQIWRVILADLLYISPREQNRGRISWRPLVRELALSFIIRSILFILRTAAAVRGSREASPSHVLEEMFTLDPQQRGNFLRLQPYWDVSQDGIADLEELLSDSFDPDNPISVAVVELIIQLRARRDGNQDLDVVERIYQRYFDPAYPTMAPAQLVFNTGLLLRRQPELPDQSAWEIYHRLQQQHLRVGGMYYMTPEVVHESSYLEMYSILEYQLFRETCPQLLFETVTRAVDQYRRTKNLKPMPGLTADGSGVAPSLPAMIAQIETLAVVRNLPEQALEAARPIISLISELVDPQKQPDPNVKRLLEIFGRMLARMRIYFPDLVDNFLEDTSASESIRHQVRTVTVEENLWGDYLSSRYGTFGLRTIFIPAVRRELWAIFELSVAARSVEAWLLASMKRIVNFVYGQEIFLH